MGRGIVKGTSMKHLKKNPLYVAFINTFGWYMASVQTDQRIRLAMFFIQAVCFEFAKTRRIASPTSVEETVNFIETMMKPRKKGRDDAVIELLATYLASIRFDHLALLKLKEDGYIKNEPFWDLVYVYSVANGGKQTLKSATDAKIISDTDTIKVQTALTSELKGYRTLAGSPADAILDRAKMLLHAFSNYNAADMIGDIIEQSFRDQCVEIENMLNVKSGG